MSHPLEGTTVWCTRAGRAGERSCVRLHELGATIVHAPTLCIEPVAPSGEDLEAVRRIARDAVIAVTSPTSVHNFVAALGARRDDGAPWPVVAVGQKTALRAKDLGLQVLATSPRATAGDLVPCVLDASGAAVIVPGSNLRRPQLAEGLRAAGREVLELTVQETRPLDGLPEGLPDDLSTIDLVVAYSPSALGFVRSLSAAHRESVLGIPLAVMGPTTGAEGRALGFEVAVEPPDPHEDHLVEAICRWATPGS